MAKRKAVRKVKRTPAPEVFEVPPEYEPLEQADVAKAKEAATATAAATVAPVVEKVVAEAKAAKGKKGVVTMDDLERVAAASAKAAVDALMPAIGSAIIQANVPRVAGAVAQVPGNYRPPLRRCYLCSQDERVCGGGDKTENHVKMVVGPKRYPEFGKWFRGAGINGVWYRSDHPNHKIVVPVAALGSILAQVEAFEEDERQTSQRRSGGHDHGTVSDETGQRSTRKASEATGWR